MKKKWLIICVACISILLIIAFLAKSLFFHPAPPTNTNLQNNSTETDRIESNNNTKKEHEDTSDATSEGNNSEPDHTSGPVNIEEKTDTSEKENTVDSSKESTEENTKESAEKNDVEETESSRHENETPEDVWD